MSFAYLDISEIYLVHEKMLDIGGGKAEVRDFNLLHSAIERPKATFDGKELYESIWFKAAALIQSLIKNHPFYDGNKRTGYFATLRFFNKNNYDIKASQKEIVDFALAVDMQNLSINEIATWFKKRTIKCIA